ncbi:gliding motility lipoprotein GldB [Flavobacteriaceae bacterium]|nr:gliding motility lipoprotein GldB [Flavobacteriaceae bacterium]
MEKVLEIDRFDLEFGASDVSDLNRLKDKYPFFFPQQTPDSIWEFKLKDSVEKQISKEISRVFGEFTETISELSHLNAHFKLLFNSLKTESNQAIYLPKVYTLSTLTSGLDIQNRVVVTDSMWLIALDHYLGPDHEYYKTFPHYVKQDLDARYILTDFSAALVAPLVALDNNGYFLDKMVYEGKKVLLQSLVWPHATEAQHLKYTEAQYQWAVENEAQVWRYFLEREYLYSTDTDLEYRFLFPAPFSKFQLVLDRESSPRIGQFIGFQMVKAYYEKHDKNLLKLLEVSAIDLLREASYKPKK